MSWWTAVTFMIGMFLGSLVNIVSRRLPKYMEAQWRREHDEMNDVQVETQPLYRIFTSRSHCPQCNITIKAWHTIPLIGFLALKGKCAACQGSIGWRYPAVELFVGGLFACCFAKWGFNETGLAWAGFAATLVTLALIDWDTYILPDSMTLPLVWAGMIAAANRWTPIGLTDSMWGAVGGYLSLWTIYWAFKLIRGKEGMGYGDFKLFAALGAWFGWQGLIPLILMASVVGAVVGIALQLNRKLRVGEQIPFGPYLVGAGLVGVYLGPFGLRSFTAG